MYTLNISLLDGTKLTTPAKDRDAAMVLANEALRGGLTITWADGFRRVPPTAIADIVAQEGKDDDDSSDETPSAGDGPSPGDTGRTPSAEPKAGKAPAKKAAKSEGGDDLKKINKIGPAFEKRLNALGIHSYADLAGLTDADIDKHEESDSMTSIEQWHAWIEEAKGLV